MDPNSMYMSTGIHNLWIQQCSVSHQLMDVQSHNQLSNEKNSTCSSKHINLIGLYENFHKEENLLLEKSYTDG